MQNFYSEVELILKETIKTSTFIRKNTSHSTTQAQLLISTNFMSKVNEHDI